MATEIRLLGVVEVLNDGHVVLLGGAKPRALLAILALHANEPVSADRLVEGLWGERPPATASKLVQVHVSQLRKHLADADAEIVTRGRGYALRVDPDVVDAVRFERLLSSGENGAHASEALALWRGPPLDDLADQPFAAPEIRRLVDLWTGAREAAIDAALAGGREAEVLDELEVLVREHPLRERLRAQQMLALYRLGRQADALAAFRDARRLLLDELGLEPGPELRRLNDAILRQDPELDGPRAGAFPSRRRRRHGAVVAGASAAAFVIVAIAVAALAARQSPGANGPSRIAEDTTGVIDPGSGLILHDYPAGHPPVAMTTGGGSVWTANGRDGTVSRLQAGEATTIPVGGEPTAVAFGLGSLWVADGENGGVEQVDPATNRPIRRWAAGNRSRGVAVADGAVWITSAVDGQVTRLDVAGGGKLTRTDVPGGPAAIAAGDGGLWVAGEDDAVVTRLDPRSGQPLKPFGVGGAPEGIALGYGGAWVVNRDDGTVTRIDEAANTVSDWVRVGGHPEAVAAGLGAIWVADSSTDSVIRIDPKTRKPGRRYPLGSPPTALAVDGGAVWAATTAAPARHRGGTLRVEAKSFFWCDCMDPAADGWDWPELSLAYDGLLAYQRTQGAGGNTVLPDLAQSIPQPTDGGRTYTFQLRPGLRFSDGEPVRPRDVRASIERAVRLAAPDFDGVVGAEACRPQACDLSKGIELGDAARTVTFHLRRPDPEFPDKLALPLAYVLPAGTPVKLITGRPPPGTGPYTITAFSPHHGVRFARNPRFRSGSAQARPDGYPDAIDVSFTDDPAARVAAVRDGEADAVAITGVFSGLIPPAMAHRLWLTDAPHIHTAPAAVTVFLFLNVHAAPFDDRRVRQALNYAFDRRRVVELVGEGLAGESCQVLPPGLPGYVPTCPYTLDPTPAGTWSAPDLESARRLVAASGTRGAAIQIWAHTGQWDNVVRYAVQVLRRLGYRVRLREIGPPNDLGPYSTYVNDPRHHAQAGFAGWVDDYLTASSFFEPFSCAARGPGAYDPSQFCAPAVDAEARRAVAAGEPAADARWSALDRRLLAAAPLVPLFTPREAVLVSDRVGNVQIQPALGPLLDQMWVR